MRKLIAAAIVSVTIAAPAVARDMPPPPAAELADRLADPMVQEGVAGAVSALAGIVLDTRVGPLARYTDGRIRPNDTLRDVKRRDDPYFEARLHNDTRRAVRTAGAVAGDATAMAGELSVTVGRLRAALAPFVDYAARRYDDRSGAPDDYDDDY